MYVYEIPGYFKVRQNLQNLRSFQGFLEVWEPCFRPTYLNYLYDRNIYYKIPGGQGEKYIF